MIKNRENNDKLLVCAEENKVYLWKATDGKPFHITFLLYKMTQFTETNQDFANELYKVPIQRESISILRMTVQMLSTKYLRRRMGFIGSNYLEMFQKR
jgi:hypothetical protein